MAEQNDKALMQYLILLFVVSVVCGALLFGFNRAAYNTWFLGLEKGQWSFWPGLDLGSINFEGYWQWGVGRTLIILCLAAWAVALCCFSGLMIMFFRKRGK